MFIFVCIVPSARESLICMGTYPGPKSCIQYHTIAMVVNDSICDSGCLTHRGVVGIGATCVNRIIKGQIRATWRWCGG